MLSTIPRWLIVIIVIALLLLLLKALNVIQIHGSIAF